MNPTSGEMYCPSNVIAYPSSGPLTARIGNGVPEGVRLAAVLRRRQHVVRDGLAQHPDELADRGQLEVRDRLGDLPPMWIEIDRPPLGASRARRSFVADRLSRTYCEAARKLMATSSSPPRRATGPIPAVVVAAA